MSLQFFIADDGVHGRELYVTDGTPVGTRLLKDINPGIGGSYVGGQVQSNGILYFAAYDGAATHLWRTDGTNAGTYVLTSSANGDGSGNLIDVNGTLFFTGADSAHGSGLFKSDGTIAGTTFVRPVSNTSQFTAVGSTLFFQAFDSTNGYELWKSDGTSGGTGIVKDIYPGSTSASVGNLTASNGKLFFTANDGATGTELWVSDGSSSGTYSIKDINLGANGSGPSSLFAAGGFVYFFAYDGVRTNFYATNGAPGNAAVLSVPNPVASSFTRFNNAFYFVAGDNAGGQAIYTSDGSRVTRLAHLSSAGSVFYDLGSQLVFYGDDGTHGGGLYSFNGTSTTFLSAVSGGFNTPVVAAGKLFFVSADSANGNELWVYDGSSVHLTKDVNPGPYDGNIQNISPVQNGVVFTATRPDVGTELFYSDGTAANTGLVADVNMAVDHATSLGIVSNFVTAGSLTFFAANDGIHGNELWVGDGTAGGSHQVADLAFGATGSDPANFFSAGGTIYFTADSRDGTGRQLYTSDGATITRLSTSTAPGAPNPNDVYFFVLNNTLYYRGYDSSGGGLYRASPTGVTKVSATTFDGNALPLGAGVVFHGSDATHGSGLYTFDGSTLTFVGSVNDYRNPAVSSGKFYFRSYDGASGIDHVWVYDGTSVHQTLDVSPGYNASPANITGLGDGRAVFTAYNPSYGSELYITDGSTDPSKTGLLKDVNPTGNHAASLSIGSNVVAAGNLGFFSASDGIHGYELWVGDGTATGSRQVADFVPGANGLDPSNLHAAGGTIYFTADAKDGTGRQLYTSDGSAIVRLSSSGAPGAPYASDAYFFVINNTLYYYGSDSSSFSGYSLFGASPTGITKIVAASFSGTALPFGNGVVFQGSDATHGSGLYTFDGTTLTFVASINDYQSPTVSGGKLYFRSSDGGNGAELWVYDGTSVHLTADLNPGVDGSSPANITGLGDGRAVFTASNPTYGSEVFVSDGSTDPTKTTLLKDINPNGDRTPSLDIASQIVSSGGKAYFVADGGGVYGNELFVSDGTTVGTHIVKDIISGTTGSNPVSLYAFNNKLFFLASDGSGTSRQLFATDGTSGNTVQLTFTNNTAPLSNGSAINQKWFTLGGKFYYVGSDPVGAYAIYTSDGTSSGTSKIVHLSANPTGITQFGGIEYFQGNDGTSGPGLYTFNGTTLSFLKAVSGQIINPIVAGNHLFYYNAAKLYATDGTAANSGVVDANGSYNSGPGYAAPLPNGKLVYSNYTQAGGVEPYVSDGTTAGTGLLADLMPGADSSGPYYFTTVGSKVFFAANYADSAGNHGRELFVTDGSAAGTHVVKDIVPGSDSSSPANLFSFNGLLYFNATDPSTSSAQLWTSDGTDTGTTHFIVPGLDTGNPANFLAAGDGQHFYFTANAGLFYSDGTIGGTTLVIDNSGFDANKYAIVSGSLYFQHYDGTNSNELWKADGATAVRVSDTLVPNGSNAGNFTFVGTANGARIFFSADDGTHGQELWVTDGTTNGTRLIDVVPGTGGSNPSNFFAFAGKLYFNAYDAAANAYKLWTSDGTTAQMIGTGDGTDNGSPANFLAKDATHFFFTGNGGLFYSDGTTGGTTLVIDNSGFDASKYAIVNGLLYFQHYDANGYELWRSDGTPGGTGPTTDTLVPNGSNAGNFTFVGTANGARIFFSADDGTHGQELWVTDGTTNGTRLIDVVPGTGGSNPSNFFAFAGKLYFNAYDAAANAYKLWTSDGTTAQMIGTGDGTDNGSPANFLAKDATHFFFTGNGGLFYSDGTTGGTTLVTPISNFDVNHYAVSSGVLFFQKSDAPNGSEQWRSDGTVAGTYRITDTYTPLSSSPSSFAAIDNLPPTVTNAAQTAIGDNQTNHPFQNTVIGDPDLPVQTMTVTVTPDDPAKGGFTAASLTATGFASGGVGGSYTFTGTPAQATTAIQGLVYQPVANRLVVGQSETMGFTVAVNDGKGGSVVNSATTVTQTSINDTPVAGNNGTSVNEDATAATATRSTGLLGNASDVDTGETATLVVSGAHAGTSGTDTAVAASGTTDIAGTYGTLHLAADGTYSYSPNSAAAEALPQGTPATETFTYTVADVHGAATTATLTFAITGQNDAPVAAADTASVNEDGTVTTSTRAAGLLGNDTDVDTGETATLVVSGAHAGRNGTDTAVASSGMTMIGGTYGDLILKADGTYSYSPNNAAAQALPQGTVVTDAFGYTVTDVQGATTTSTLTFTVTGVDDPAVARDDANSVLANRTITNATVLANDTDVDGPALKVGSVNGSGAIVDNQIQLDSGALLTLRADGTYDYDPNHAFDYLTGVSGAANSSATDSFTYGLVGGGTATVTITVQGVSSPGVPAKGTVGNDTMAGTSANDYFDLSQGGNDTASGGGGDDAFYFGAAFTAADTVDGGSGTNNQIGLEGDYTGARALTLGSTTIANIQVLATLPGHSYDITSNDGNVAAGQTLTIFGGNLRSGNSLTFNGSAETDGHFRIYGGLGNDHLVGGALDDGFYFGPGKFNPATDFVDGRGGANNQLALDGNYSIALSGSSIQNIQVVALLAGPASGRNNFHLTTDGTLVPNGGQVTIWGATVTTNMSIDGSAETNGRLTIYGGQGADTITGGAGNDTIYGGLGADTLTGGPGHNTFRYDSASDSTATGQDTITDFKLGDLLDLSRIDANSNTAGHDAFNFIGANAFHSVAGELRYQAIDATHVFVQGDVNGDGVADLSILLSVTDGHVLTSNDFVV